MVRPFSKKVRLIYTMTKKKQPQTKTKLKTTKNQHTPPKETTTHKQTKTQKPVLQCYHALTQTENSAGLDNPYNVKTNPIFSSSFRHLQLLPVYHRDSLSTRNFTLSLLRPLHMEKTVTETV